ncbi:MAG: hypothetical protein RLZ10_1479 [Bacteroidota bacterium]|jgi:hypothetical protein
MKIFGVGLPKTGTTSLYHALNLLGYKPHISWTQDASNLFGDGKIHDLIKIANLYQSFEDYPWCMIYRELDIAFPGSKFIGTRRNNINVWAESRIRHSFYIDGEDFRGKNNYISEQKNLYTKHYDDLRSYFKKRPKDYIELCWEEGDDWNKLCTFLDRDIPEFDFPNIGKSSPIKENLK